MAFKKIVISCVVLFGLFSVVYTRNIQAIEQETPSNSTQSPSRNLDDISGLTPAVLTCAVLTQLLLPFFLWCCGRWCKACCGDVNEQQEEQRRLEKLGEMIDAKSERDESKCRLLSIHYYFSFFVWLSYLIAYNTSSWEKHGAIFSHLQIMAIVTMIFSTLVVLFESKSSKELAHLENIMDGTAWSYIQRMHNLPPRITMSVVCFHFEERTEFPSRTSDFGSNSSRKVTEKVVTYTEKKLFPFNYWVDESEREMPLISRAALTRLTIDSYVTFGDRETGKDFESMKKEMKERTRRKDVHMDFSIHKEIPGLEKRVCAYVDLSNKPWWIGKGFYWLATLLMLTWPYRWLFRAMTAKGKYELKKKIYKSTAPPREGAVDNMDPMALLQASIPGASIGPFLTLTER